MNLKDQQGKFVLATLLGIALAAVIVGVYVMINPIPKIPEGFDKDKLNMGMPNTASRTSAPTAAEPAAQDESIGAEGEAAMDAAVAEGEAAMDAAVAEGEAAMDAAAEQAEEAMDEAMDKAEEAQSEAMEDMAAQDGA